MTEVAMSAAITTFGSIVVALITGIFLRLGHVEKNVNGNLKMMTDELKAQRDVIAALRDEKSYNRGVKDGKDEKDAH